MSTGRGMDFSQTVGGIFDDFMFSNRGDHI